MQKIAFTEKITIEKIIVNLFSLSLLKTTKEIKFPIILNIVVVIVRIVVPPTKTRKNFQKNVKSLNQFIKLNRILLQNQIIPKSKRIAKGISKTAYSVDRKTIRGVNSSFILLN